MLLLTGCGKFFPLPDRERYQFINQALEAIDYKTAGEITLERKDKGDGLVSPSFYAVLYEGQSAYPILVERMRSNSDIECPDYVSEIDTRCMLGTTNIEVNWLEEENLTMLKVIDRYSGRNGQV